MRLEKVGVEVLLRLPWGFCTVVAPLEPAMSYQTLYVTEMDRVVTVTLNRPERRNALNPQLIDELIAVIDTMARRSSGVLIVTGMGAAFCAGMDLEHLKSLTGKTAVEHREDSERIASLFRKLYDLPLPTIAAVNGHAIAGGMGLATICDFTISVPEAKFGYTEARIGFVPALVSSFLLRQIGEKKSRDLLLTARLIPAEEAREIGLVNEVVTDSNLISRARQLAHQLLQNSPESLRATKSLLSAHAREQLDRELAAAIESNTMARGTDDFFEGISAFLEKRTPNWHSHKSEKETLEK
ncbi:MAG: enoyl-CoA hydratase-related protein [Acidobacteriaceae bacterium]